MVKRRVVPLYMFLAVCALFLLSIIVHATTSTTRNYNAAVKIIHGWEQVDRDNKLNLAARMELIEAYQQATGILIYEAKCSDPAALNRAAGILRNAAEKVKTEIVTPKQERP